MKNHHVHFFCHPLGPTCPPLCFQQDYFESSLSGPRWTPMGPRIPLLPPMFPISRQSLWNLPANMPLILLEPIDPPHSKLTFSWLHSHYLLHLTPSLGILLCPPLISCPGLIPRTPSYLFCCLLQVRGLFHLLSFLPPINLLFAIDCIPLLE